jgi:ribosomal protein S6
MAKKNAETQEETLEAGTEPRVYELGFHLDPELPQEEVKGAYQTIRDHIAGLGTVVAEGEPVKVPLAYTISRMETTGRRDFNSAYFCWIAYEADGAGHEQISAMAREDSRIVRFLDIRTTVDEAKHSAEMQEMFAQATAGTAEEESVEVETVAAPEAEPEAETTPEKAA